MKHYDTNQIYCADCRHCKQFRSYSSDGRTFVLRVRCAKGMWRYPSGREKTYDRHTLLDRRPKHCPHYDPMSETPEELAEYLDYLKRTLPFEKVVYDANTGEEVRDVTQQVSERKGRAAS